MEIWVCKRMIGKLMGLKPKKRQYDKYRRGIKRKMSIMPATAMEALLELPPLYLVVEVEALNFGFRFRIGCGGHTEVCVYSGHILGPLYATSGFVAAHFFFYSPNDPKFKIHWSILESGMLLILVMSG